MPFSSVPGILSRHFLMHSLGKPFQRTVWQNTLFKPLNAMSSNLTFLEKGCHLLRVGLAWKEIVMCDTAQSPGLVQWPQSLFVLSLQSGCLQTKKKICLSNPKPPPSGMRCVVRMQREANSNTLHIENYLWGRCPYQRLVFPSLFQKIAQFRGKIFLVPLSKVSPWPDQWVIDRRHISNCLSSILGDGPVGRHKSCLWPQKPGCWVYSNLSWLALVHIWK